MGAASERTSHNGARPGPAGSIAAFHPISPLASLLFAPTQVRGAHRGAA